MSEAIIALQSAAVSALLARPGLAALTGIYDGPPPQAPFPFVALDATAADWSTKTEAGREVRLAVTLWDDPGQALRLYELMAEVSATLSALPRDLGGWRVASNVFVRSLIARDPERPWAGLVEHRVRVLATI